VAHVRAVVVGAQVGQLLVAEHGVAGLQEHRDWGGKVGLAACPAAVDGVQRGFAFAFVHPAEGGAPRRNVVAHRALQLPMSAGVHHELSTARRSLRAQGDPHEKRERRMSALVEPIDVPSVGKITTRVD